MGFSKNVFEVAYDGIPSFRYKTLSNLKNTEFGPSHTIRVYDLVPVFEGKNYKEVEDFMNNRKKPTKKNRSTPDDIVPGII